MLSYGALRTEPDAIHRLLWGVMVPGVALLAVAVFIVQRGAARAHGRLLCEVDDVERQSPLERFMASHEPWQDRQGD